MTPGTRGKIFDSPTPTGKDGLVGAYDLNGHTGTIMSIGANGSLIIIPDPIDGRSVPQTICIDPAAFRLVEE